MLPPVLTEPPRWPLPDPSEDAQWYGEVWLQYPLNNQLFPSELGHVLHLRSRFRVIMNDFCGLAFSEGFEVSLDKANQLLALLEDWFAGLPEPLLPMKIVLPGHIQLQ